MMDFDASIAAANDAAMADISAANTVDTPAPDIPAVEGQPAAAVDTPAPAAATPAPTEGQSPVADTQETPAPAAQATPATEQPATPSTAWTFTRKGQQVTITDPKQAEELIRQGFDYTQKTMELAEQRRQLEAQARAVLTNRELLKQQLAYLEAQQGPVVTPAPADRPTQPAPDDLINVQQTQQLIQAQLREAEARMQAQAQRAVLEAETARYTEEYRGSVSKTLAAVTERFPLLKDIEKVDKLILDDVSDKVAAQIQLEPEKVVSIDDVNKLIVEVAERRHNRLHARLQEHQKMQAVRAAKVQQQGIEPAGGQPPAAEPEPVYKLDDPRLTEQVIRELSAAFSRKG